MHRPMKAYLAWAFFDREWVQGEDEEEIEEYVREMESMLRRNLQPGKGTAKSLRLTLDPVEILHRSLLWYSVMSAHNHVLHLANTVMLCSAWDLSTSWLISSSSTQASTSTD